MFQAAGSFDLHCLNKQDLIQRYESEEEDTSESEVGQDNSFSPIEFQRVDSDLSADDETDSHPERTDFSHLLPRPYQSTNNDPRPLSMDTIKRRSDATFVAGSCIYNHEDDMVIQLPSPENSPPLHSSTFLQPTVYAPPESRRSSKRQSIRSPSPSSYLSDDDTDVFVAEQVTYVEPETKPNLILISPTTTESSTDEAPTPVNTETSHEVSRNRSVKREQSDHVSPLRRSIELFSSRGMSRRSPFSDLGGDENTRSAGRPIQRGKSLENIGASATISCLSEVPTVPYPMSSRSQSISVPRPQTSIPEKTQGTHSRSGSKSLRRPPSLRSVSSFNLPFFQPRPSTPRFEDHHARSMSCSNPMYGPDPVTSRMGRPYTGTSSPAPYCSPPALMRDRSDSVYSSSNMSCYNNSSPLPRKQTTKHSAASSIYSTNSFRSNTPSDNSHDDELADTSFKQKVHRRKTLKRTKQNQPENTEKPTEKSFLGIRLGGKRKSAMKSLNF